MSVQAHVRALLRTTEVLNEIDENYLNIEKTKRQQIKRRRPEIYQTNNSEGHEIER